ncbi:MAG: VpsR-related response regulator [Gammaproteobacteria bacterium]
MPGRPQLLSIVELGGYPDFTPQFERAGYQVTTVRSMRKALAALKRLSPAVVVAEFNFQSDFRDRTSSLESLLATLQSRHPQARVVVLYDRENEQPFEQRLRSRWRVDAALAFPVEPDRIAAVLGRLGAEGQP